MSELEYLRRQNDQLCDALERRLVEAEDHSVGEVVAVSEAERLKAKVRYWARVALGVWIVLLVATVVLLVHALGVW